MVARGPYLCTPTTMVYCPGLKMLVKRISNNLVTSKLFVGCLMMRFWARCVYVFNFAT